MVTDDVVVVDTISIFFDRARLETAPLEEGERGEEEKEFTREDDGRPDFSDI